MSKPAANGYNGVFHRPCKKIVLDYCETWGSSEGMRSFIQSEKAGPASIAERHPEVEVVVRRRPFKHPVLRGLYRKSSREDAVILDVKLRAPSLPCYSEQQRQGHLRTESAAGINSAEDSAVTG